MPSSKISPAHSSLQVPSGPEQVVHERQEDANIKQTTKKPIFSISRLTQMARTRTLDQSSPVSQAKQVSKDCLGSQIARDYNDSSSTLNKLHRRASRLKSQASIISIISSQAKTTNQRPVDVEGDKFLRRFATNNQSISMDQMSSALNSNESQTFRKLCLNL